MPVGYDAASRYAQLLARSFGADTDLTPPGISLEDGTLPDWQFTKRSHLWTFGQSLVAQVAIANGISIGNVSSGQILTITAILNRQAGLRIFDIATALNANYGAFTQLAFRNDGRYIGTRVSGVGISAKSAGGISGGSTTGKFMLGAGIFTPPGWFTVLMPGQNLTIETDVVNTILDFNAMGYMRDAEAAEIVQ